MEQQPKFWCQWHSVTFRLSEREYAFTHAVYIEHIPTPQGEKWVPRSVLCGSDLPEPTKENIAAFAAYIDKRVVDCPGCQIKHNAEELKR